MATFVKRLGKNGRITYKVQTKVDGVQVATTWKNPDNLNGKRAEREAIAFGKAWENDLRNKKPEPEKEVIVAPLPLTFSEVADDWLRTNRHRLSENYVIRSEELIARMKKEWPDKLFEELKARDTQQFFVGLNTARYQTSVANLKPAAMDDFNKAVLDYGVRKMRGETISAPTLFQARKGGNIQWSSAVLICETLGIPVNDFFDKNTIGKPYKKETILKYKRVLSAIYTHAIQNEIVTTNYAASAYLKKIIGGEESDDVELLSQQEQDRLIEILGQQHILHAIPIYLMFFLGIRCCEACGVEWRDVDYDKGIIHIRRDRIYVPHKGVKVGKTKTKYSIRDLPITGLLLEKLKECKKYYDTLRDRDPDFDESGAIYCDLDGKPGFPHYLNKILKRCLSKAGCHIVTCHKLRHGWITDMIDNGAKIPLVSRLAGHASPAITLKVYTHYRKDTDNSVDILKLMHGRYADTAGTTDKVSLAVDTTNGHSNADFEREFNEKFFSKFDVNNEDDDM